MHELRAHLLLALKTQISSRKAAIAHIQWPAYRTIAVLSKQPASDNAVGAMASTRL